MFGERKSEIFDLIPQKYIPATKLISKGDLIKAKLEAHNIGFPLIAKPDVGERGIWVSKITDENELAQYVTNCPVDFLLQELIEYPLELGVFFVKYPGKDGKITSIVRKEFLEVVGNGKDTVRQLLKGNSRALLTADLTSKFLVKVNDKILDEKESLVIETIGNHCSGHKIHGR